MFFQENGAYYPLIERPAMCPAALPRASGAGGRRGDPRAGGPRWTQPRFSQERSRRGRPDGGEGGHDVKVNGFAVGLTAGMVAGAWAGMRVQANRRQLKRKFRTAARGAEETFDRMVR